MNQTTITPEMAAAYFEQPDVQARVKALRDEFALITAEIEAHEHSMREQRRSNPIPVAESQPKRQETKPPRRPLNIKRPKLRRHWR